MTIRVTADNSDELEALMKLHTSPYAMLDSLDYQICLWDQASGIYRPIAGSSRANVVAFVGSAPIAGGGGGGGSGTNEVHHDG